MRPGFFALVWVAVVAACGHSDGPPSPTTDQACAILNGGAVVSLMGGGHSQGPGEIVQAGGVKYSIALPQSVAAPNVYAGRVQWVVDAPGRYAIFRQEGPPFLIRNTANEALPVLRSAGASLACPAIGRSAFVEISTAGTYSLEFAASDLATATVTLLPIDPGEKL